MKTNKPIDNTSNNEKIKELKEAAISAKQYKWWLYFGG